ncbi:MAG: hypothetical protein WBN75_17535 [Verrucomicrobiia bacterium]|jgi:hypothetical protein
MSESWQISSLSEFLESIEGKPFDEAKDQVQAEYATVSRMIEEVRRARKTGNPSRVNPASSEYFADLLCLVNAMDGHLFALDNASADTRHLIESALKKWHHKK